MLPHREKCEHFALGHCINGSSCDKYHDPADDPALPIDESDALAVLYRSNPHIKPCWFFLQGQCKWESCCMACQVVIKTLNNRRPSSLAPLSDPTKSTSAPSGTTQTTNSAMSTNPQPQPPQCNPPPRTLLSPQTLARAFGPMPPPIPVQSLPSTSTLGNRQYNSEVSQSSVVSTWFQPAASASLRYDSVAKAIQAEEIAKSIEIRGRHPKCFLKYLNREMDGKGPIDLRLHNLVINTTMEEVLRNFRGPLEPASIKMGRTQYLEDDEEESALRVKEMMKKHGKIVWFEYDAAETTAKPDVHIMMKAITTFGSQEQAKKAAAALHGQRMFGLGNQTIHVWQAVMAKYEVPTVLLDSLGDEIQKLVEMIWKNGRIHLKMDPLDEVTALTNNLIDISDTADSSTMVRIFTRGNHPRNLQSLAKAKTAFEKLLNESSSLT